MTMKRGITCFLSGIFFLCMVGQVQAVSMITYDVNASLTGGGMLSGTIEIDSANSPLGAVTSWDMLTSGGVDLLGNPIASMVWDSSTSGFAAPALNNIVFSILNGGGRSLTLAWLPTFLNQPGPYTFGVLETYSYDVQFGPLTVSFPGARGGLDGTAAAVPEPGTALLLGSGLVGLGLWRWRKSAKA